jgi:predicted DNA-binding antitoxin AbrB/MazE fold protein
MTHVTEAIYTQGVLRPVEHLDLPDQQRVRLIVAPINGIGSADREAALEHLWEIIEQGSLYYDGPSPRATSCMIAVDANYTPIRPRASSHRPWPFRRYSTASRTAPSPPRRAVT